jgi:hypothetical protein
MVEPFETAFNYANIPDGQYDGVWTGYYIDLGKNPPLPIPNHGYGNDIPIYVIVKGSMIDIYKKDGA